MTELMSVEMPDEAAATTLARRLGAEFETDLHRHGARCALRISIDRPSDQAVSELLSAVDDWLAGSDLETLSVQIAGRSYVLGAS
jgi:hypothetical protein